MTTPLGQSVFILQCIITLVYTNNLNSIASPNDFDDNKTNYIDIVASCELSGEMMDLLNKLAKYLNSSYLIYSQ